MDEEEIDGGAPPADDLQAKLNTFRASNRELMQTKGTLEQTIAQLNAGIAERDQKLSAIGDSDPNKIKSALDLLNSVEGRAEAELIQAGRIDEVMDMRMKPRVAEYQKELSARDQKIASLTEMQEKAAQVASNLMLERQVRAAVTDKKLRVHASAEDDLMTRARRDWKVSEDLDGNLISANPSNIADDIAAWVDTQVQNAPHLWAGGDGGGARPGPGKIGADGVRIVKRSDVSDKDYANVLREQKAGKVRIVQQ